MKKAPAANVTGGHIPTKDKALRVTKPQKVPAPHDSDSHVMRRENGGVRVAVIVDDEVTDHRRREFWSDGLGRFKFVDVEIVSLVDRMARRQFFDVYEYDLIIFNWCVLDGAVMYESDRAQRIVKFYDAHFHRFVRNGGIVLFEGQPKRWHPEQRAYDTLLAGEVRVLKTAAPLMDDKARTSRSHSQHPLIAGLPSVLNGVAHGTAPWFPEGSTSVYSTQELRPKLLYAGAFRRWTPRWIPLLYTSDEQYPVLMAKLDGSGLWLVSTMFIGSSAAPELIDHIVRAVREGRAPIQNYHARHDAVRRRDGVVAGLILLALLGVAYSLVAKGIIGKDIPYGNTVLGSIILSLAITGLMTFVWRIGLEAWRRIRLSLNRW